MSLALALLCVGVGVALVAALILRISYQPRAAVKPEPHASDDSEVSQRGQP